MTKPHSVPHCADCSKRATSSSKPKREQWDSSLPTRGPDLVLLDIGLPDGSGLNSCRGSKSCALPHRGHETAYERVKDIVMAIKRGAFDYLVKPVDLDEFELTIQNALEHAGLKNEVSRLRQEVQRSRA